MALLDTHPRIPILSAAWKKSNKVEPELKFPDGGYQ
jgi:hypothetical protein